eukprot:TRINITY_DN6591_c0_g1_i3.p1 TRINITY_DN6591_c0_g1~~TRINITY_DN6591_c0_g1_i3.p1  ORF type:complete len:660 (+),score=227.59 TRINITY_DN6591_c0_g1_i3:242-1981(+)
MKKLVVPSQQSKMSLSSNQLVDLYAECIKLSTENKINQKNTWQLNLIDYIDDVLSVQGREGPQEITNFQTASATLDASVKIYSSRVDSVHHETFKVLGGLNRAEQREESGSGKAEKDSAAGEADAEDAEQTKEKKRTKKVTIVGGVNTLESNLENISVKKFDMMFDVDPLFKKTTAQFDEAGTRGLLLNQLSVYNNCELVFDSSDAVESSKDVDANAEIDITELRKKLKIKKSLDDLSICPTYNNFEFGKIQEVDEDLDLDAELEAFSDDDIPAIEFMENQDEFNLNTQHETNFADQQEANLMEDLMSQEADDEDGEKHNRSSVAPSVNGKMEIPMVLTTENEFGYFDPKLLENWAGPNHWRFRPKKATDAEDGESGSPIKKTKKAGKKKEPFFINFENEDDMDDIFDTSKSASTTLSTALLKKAQNNNNTLPPDVHYDVNMLTQLFNKPKWRVSLARRKKLMEAQNSDMGHGESVPWKENQNDDMGGFDGGGDFDDNAGFGNPGLDLNDGLEGDNQFFEPPNLDLDGNFNLVQAPRRVEQIRVNYAKNAKVVDVKALKDSLWRQLRPVVVGIRVELME